MKAKYRYVYIEDDPLSCEIMHVLLTEVVGVESLHIIDDTSRVISQLLELEALPDFILMDIHMEPRDGYDLLRSLREEPRLDNCKAIAVTASVMSEEVKRLKQSGFDGALAKPLDMAVFPALIGQLEAGEAIWQID